jgi:hypothetical protein
VRGHCDLGEVLERVGGVDGVAPRPRRHAVDTGERVVGLAAFVEHRDHGHLAHSPAALLTHRELALFVDPLRRPAAHLVDERPIVEPFGHVPTISWGCDTHPPDLGVGTRKSKKFVTTWRRGPATDRVDR